jgi:hypothetical protein
MDKKTMLQINKQILQLAMQQDDLNAVLGNMLSTAECLANRFGNKPQQSFFDAYNLYGSGNTKNEEALKTQLQIQTKIFRNNHNYMINRDGKYPFPENLGKKEIEDLLNLWKDNSKLENQFYFENIIKILNGNYELTFPQRKVKTNGINPKVTLELFPQVMKDVDKTRKKVKEEVIEKGKYDNNLNLNQNRQDNTQPTSVPNEIDMYEQEKIELLQYLYNIFWNIELYIYHTYLKNKKIKPYLIYGNKEEYKSYKPIEEFQINLKIELVKQKYVYYCQYNDISNDKEINQYKDSCTKWMKDYKNDKVINKLNEIFSSEVKKAKNESSWNQ